MRLHLCKSWMVVVLCGIHGFSAYSATSLFSDYGQIQNVQNYSSNPFWNPNSPYNQKLPQPVYVQGAALNSEDCMKAVYYLVSVQCMARNNCQNTSLSDIRPEIMVQLSKLPGANYVSSCSGYIDTAYNSYVEQYKDNSVAFPDAPVLQQVNIQNPYKQKPSKQQQEIIDRKKELQELQKQNGAGSEHLSATEFPMTYDDLSFTAKTQLMTEGYAPFKDKKAYAIPDFISKKKWCAGEGKGSKECEEPKKEEPVQTTTTTTTEPQLHAPTLDPQIMVHQNDAIPDLRPVIHEPIKIATADTTETQPAPKEFSYVVKTDPIKFNQEYLKQRQANDSTTTQQPSPIRYDDFDYAEIEVLPSTDTGCYIKCNEKTQSEITDALNKSILSIAFLPANYCVVQRYGGNPVVADLIRLDMKNFSTPKRFSKAEITAIEAKLNNMQPISDPNCKNIALKIKKYKKLSDNEFQIVADGDYNFKF